MYINIHPCSDFFFFLLTMYSFLDKAHPIKSKNYVKILLGIDASYFKIQIVTVF